MPFAAAIPFILHACWMDQPGKSSSRLWCWMPSKPCRFPGCPELVPDQGKAWCSFHSPQLDKMWNRAGKKLYGTKRWRIRSRHFLALHPICLGCGRLAETVDHVLPYESEDVLSFWSESNWQPLCLVCHSRKTRQDVSERTF